MIVASGMVFCAALLVFADGAVAASQAAQPYNFLMWLPMLVGLLGSFVLLFVKPARVLSADPDMDDEDAIKKDKGVFFVGTLLLFTSICIAVWKMVDPYGNKGDAWPGAALIVHSLLLLLMNSTLFIARAQHDED